MLRFFYFYPSDILYLALYLCLTNPYQHQKSFTKKL
ncbi:MAG: hypothetical protein FD155_3429 [Bacteroidetes bacterium]|nr:MAG: hypothetical protein FD155_3429 [Bacteroidota bacterium]